MQAAPDETLLGVARRLGLSVYLPWLFASLGRGMMLPIVPLYLRDVGLSFTTVSVVLAAVGFGAFLGGLPMGALAGRVGPEWVFAAAVVLMAVSTAVFGVSTAVFALVAFRMMTGLGSVGLRLSAQMLVNAGVTVRQRGRGMSLLGGGVRVAFFVGPLVGGVLVDTVGFEPTFVVCGVITLAGMFPFLVSRRDRPAGARFERPDVPLGDLVGVWRVHGVLLLLAGTGAALIATARQGRNVVVPLIGDDLGLGATAVGALVAIGTGADLLLFPVSGWLMDRFGRLYAIVPAFSLMAIGLLVLGVWATTPGAIVAGVVMGIGNGMSAGTMLTLGGDLAPPDSGPFLAALGMMQEFGIMVGPLVVGGLADTAGLNASAIVLAVVLLAGVAWFVVVLGDTSRPSRPWLASRIEQPREAVR